MRMVVVLFLVSATCFAGTWQGALVDGKCYDSEERNVGPNDTETSVDHDKGWEIRHCSPKAKTTAFEFVRQEDGQSFRLDSEGNAKAAELVRKAGKKRGFTVTLSGEISGSTIKVDSVVAR
jgi:hypothetical protein